MPDIDFNYRIFNHDGSEVAQCGNGARCFMRFVLQQGLTNKDCIRVKTRSGVLTLKQDHTHPDFIAVNMGRPQFDPQALPFLPDTALPDPDQIQTESGRAVSGRKGKACGSNWRRIRTKE